MGRLRTVVRMLLQRFGSAFVWQSGVKSTRASMGPFITMGSLLAGKVSPSLVLGVFGLLTAIVRSFRAEGPVGTAKRLKATSVYLARYLGDDPLRDKAVFGPTISLTGSGIPRILPPRWRLAVARRVP